MSILTFLVESPTISELRVKVILTVLPWSILSRTISPVLPEEEVIVPSPAVLVITILSNKSSLNTFINASLGVFESKDFNGLFNNT